MLPGVLADGALRGSGGVERLAGWENGGRERLPSPNPHSGELENSQLVYFVSPALSSLFYPNIEDIKMYDQKLLLFFILLCSCAVSRAKGRAALRRGWRLAAAGGSGTTGAPSGVGKTAACQEVSRRLNAPLINANLELSRAMLELTTRQRTLQMAGLLEDLIARAGADLVFLDNTEILFDVSFRQDPLRLLQSLARNRTVVASWNGAVREGFLVYALPSHPEYRRYPAADLRIVSPQSRAAE